MKTQKKRTSTTSRFSRGKKAGAKKSKKRPSSRRTRGSKPENANARILDRLTPI